MQTQTNKGNTMTDENDYVRVSSETQSFSDEIDAEQIETSSVDNSNSME